MRDVVALVLAGGRIGNYGVLTLNRAKAALTYAANYRIIDFALSNLRHAQIEHIGLIIQFLPASLIEHVGVGQAWDLSTYGRTMKIMPPFVGVEKTQWYKGTADALSQNMNMIVDLKPRDVIVLSGEHVYHLDYKSVLAAHRDSNAEITMVVKELPPERCSKRFGYVVIGDEHRVRAFAEKPEVPPSTTVSTGIYVFRTEVLQRLLAENVKTPEYNLARDIIATYAPKMNTYAYVMNDYWEYLENVQEYYQTQFDLMADENFDKLRQWGILTNLEYRGVGFAPAAKFGPHSEASNSLVAPKCHIDGVLEHSILSPGVEVRAHAGVRNTILMHDCAVAESAMLDHVISDKDARFGEGCKVGVANGTHHVDRSAEASGFTDLTLIGKGVYIGPGVVVPRGFQVRPGTRLPDQKSADTYFAQSE